MSWDKYICDGISAVSSADYAKAESALKKALHYAKENYPREDGRLAVTLSLLGHMYFQNQDFVRAEMLLEQSLRLHNQDSTGNFNEPCVLMDLFSLGEIKKATGKRAEAVKLYDQTLRRMRDSGQHSRAVVQQATERFEQLLKNTKAQLNPAELEVLESQPPPVYPPPSVETPTPVDCMPVVWPPQPQQTAAEAQQAQEQATARMQEVWQQQLQTGLTALSHEDDERETIVTGYLNCESAYRLSQALFSAADLRHIATTKGLADASAKLRLFEQAEALYKQAYDAMKKTGDASAVASSHAVHVALGLLYVDWSRFTDAKEILASEEIPPEMKSQPAFANFCKRFAKAKQTIQVWETVTDLKKQAHDAESSDDIDKASRLVNHATSILKQSFPPNHPENAQLLQYRSELLRKLGHDEQAQDIEQRVIRINKANELAAANWARIAEELPAVDEKQPSTR